MSEYYWTTRCNQCVRCKAHFQGFITDITHGGSCPTLGCDSRYAARVECRKTLAHGFTPRRGKP